MAAELSLGVLRTALVLTGLSLLIGGCGSDETATTEKPRTKRPHKADAAPTVYEAADAAKTVAKPAVADQDVEPNNTPDTAIPLIAGTSARGIIAPPEDSRQRVGDQDWYVLTIEGDKPMIARAELIGPDDLDVVLEWADPKVRRRGKYRAIVQADVQIKKAGNEILPTLALQPGKNYFRVREAWYRKRKRVGSAKPYELKVTVRPWQDGADAEPNDADPLALKVEFDTLGEGLIGHVGDRDLWRVDVPKTTVAKRLRVTITPVAGLQMTAAIRFKPLGRFLKRGRGAKGETLVFRNIELPKPGPKGAQRPKGATGKKSAVKPLAASETAANPIFVQVGARGGASVEERYTVRVSPETPPPDGAVAEAEPNDNLKSASMILQPSTDGKPSEILVYGFLDHHRDIDYYALTVDKPASLGILLTPPLDADYMFTVFGPPGQAQLTAKRAKAGQNEVMRGVGLTPGTWHLAVRRQRGKVNPKAAYALKIELGDGASSESEPNNVASGKLKTLPIGRAAKGWIYPAGDRDFWKVDLSKATEGRIATFKVKAPPAMVLKAGLYKEDGAVLTLSGRLVSETTFTHYLEPGIYRMQIWAAVKNATEAQTPYEITLLE